MKYTSLNFKVGVTLAMALISTITVSIVGIIEIDKMNDVVTEITQELVPKVERSMEAQNHVSLLRNFEKLFILEETATGQNATESKIDEEEKRAIALLDKYSETASETGKKEVAAIKEHLAQWKKVSLQLRALAREGKVKEAIVIATGPSREALINADQGMESIVTRNKKRMEDEDKKADQEYAGAKRVLLAASGLAIFLAVGLALSILRSLGRSIGGITKSLSEGSSQVGAAAEQVSTASQTLSSAAGEAASSLEETVASLEELSSMVSGNAQRCQEAAQLAEAACISSEGGAARLKELIDSMGEISQSSKKIEEIINVIDDIAFQTNLLALNAAVEAARAGEQGKGFAVVAEAVRTLAQRSSSAAKDITTLIQESVTKSEQGVGRASQSEEALQSILTQIKRVADIVTEINTASQEQSSGVQQISKAMNQLDQTTQQNAATAEESAAASEELSAQATTVNGVVEELKAVIFGRTTRTDILGQVEIMPEKGLVKSSGAPVSSAQVLPLRRGENYTKVGTTDGF